MSDSASNNNHSPSILFLLKGYPRLSETFIAQEMQALESLGIAITIASLRLPTDKKTHPVHDAIKAPLLYLPEYLYQQPKKVICAWWKVRKLAAYPQMLKAFWQDFRRDISANRLRRLGQAMVLAAEMPRGITKIHSHFIHTPTSVARYASLMSGIPFSMSAHAKDIWTIPEWEIVDKLRDGLWLTTCTQFNRDYLRDLADKHQIDRYKIDLDYHGINLSAFTVNKEHEDKESAKNKTAQLDIVQLISVGRAVPKKGYDRLLLALAQLDKNLSWHFTHIGGGELLDSLKQQATDLNLDKHISWLGSQSQLEVLTKLRQSDIFVLLSRIEDNGDRDGLPNVLMEAQSQFLPVIATNISGIPEIITDNHNGILIKTEALEEVTKALTRLISDKALRLTLGENGRAVVNKQFNHLDTIKPLYQRHIVDFERIKSINNSSQ